MAFPVTNVLNFKSPQNLFDKVLQSANNGYILASKIIHSCTF